MSVRSIRVLSWWRPVSLVVIVMAAILYWLDHAYPLPQQRSFSSVVLAKDGELLRAFSNKQQQWRYPLALSEVPQDYLTMLSTYEDRWFYWHFGVNPLAIIRAAWQNLRSHKIISGGSTLTMQVARLLDPHKRTIPGKLKQILRALQLEWHLDKGQILQRYINLAPFGGTLVGVQAASLSYFARPLDQLSDAELALLVVMPQAPSRWRPDRHPVAARAARDKVLRRMLSNGVWSSARVEDALAEPVYTQERAEFMRAPLLARRLKRDCPSCEKIDTLIDSQMQRKLSQLVKDYSAGQNSELSAALIVMDNSDGAVRTYIGSADFHNAKRSGHVDMLQAVRSPGSTLKPFLYAMAIDRGLIHAQSLLQDTPRFNRAYRPRNFSGGFNGPVSVTEALQRSLNIPAVQVLEALQPHYFVAKLRSAGLKLRGPGAVSPNASVILGGVGAKLEELVGVYAALARSGIAITPRLQRSDATRERYLLSEGAAWISWKMLAVNPHQRSGFNKLKDNWQLAWKTGTSYGYRDAWAVGVSKDWTIGVWLGRPDASAVPGITGRKTAAPLLFKAYRAIAKQGALQQPKSVSLEQTCWPLGTLVTAPHNSGPNCQRKNDTWLLDNTVPPTLSPAYSLLRPRWRNSAGLFSLPACSGETLTKEMIALWPLGLEPWLKKEVREAQLFPAMPHCANRQGVNRSLTINSIADQSLIKYRSPGVSLSFTAQGGSGLRRWYLNGRYLGQSQEHVELQYKILQRGKYQLSVVDRHGNSDAVTLTVD